MHQILDVHQLICLQYTFGHRIYLNYVTAQRMSCQCHLQVSTSLKLLMKLTDRSI